MKIGLYIHIPFCSAKCSYCDFASFSADFYVQRQYVKELKKEILRRSKDEDYIIDTVYIGGGTPSMLYRGGLSEIICAVKENMEFNPSEFTIEANPETVSKEFVEEAISNGVNRFSIGLQTQNNKLLKIFRRHTFEDFIIAFNLIKSFGIENISVDFMLGLPDQTMQDIKDTVKVILDLGLNHVSVYGLKVEENTPLYKSGYTPDEEKIAEYYEIISNDLRKIYNHYEVSNFAKNGFECKHNLKYWELQPYLGVGLSASSYLNQKRITNTRDINKYLSGDYIDCLEDVSDKFLLEYIMLGLRTDNGIDTEVLNQYGLDVLKNKNFLKYIKNGILIEDNRHLKLKKSYYFVMNSILIDLI